MRIGVISVSQETDTFNPSLTTLEHFAAFGIEHGQAIFDKLGEVGAVGGYLKAARERGGVDSVPIFKARSVAGGRISSEALAYFVQEIEKGLDEAGQLDGLALYLHGACSAEGLDDVDGHLLEVARNKLGSDVPIVIGLDHHANVTRKMVELSDGLVGHRTQPHDPFDTGYLTAHMLFKIVAGEVKPTVAYRKIPLISHQEQYLTSRHPMKTWFDRARQMEAEDSRVVQISNFPMQPWLDVEEGGWSTVVVTDDDQELAERLADELGDLAWSMREEFQLKVSLPVDEAIRQAEAEPRGVIVLSDTGDSVLGGAGGDSTVLIREMLAQGITGPALVPLVDPGIGEKLDESQVGQTVTVEVGGSVARMHEPITLTGRLAFFGPKVLHIGGGFYNPVVDLGYSAVLEVPCGVVVVTQFPGVGGTHPEMYRNFGIEPADFKMAVVKTASNFQWFGDISSGVIRVDSPGPTQSGIASLPWERIPRPVYPLDDITSWR